MKLDELVSNATMGSGCDEGLIFGDTVDGGRIVVGFEPVSRSYNGQIVYPDGRPRFVSERVHRFVFAAMNGEPESEYNLEEAAQLIVKDAIAASTPR